MPFLLTSAPSSTIVPLVLSPHTGVRFKLVKSNSCSSRLELVGTGKINSLQQHQQMHQQISQNLQRDEEKRRSILHRLQEQQQQQQSPNGASNHEDTNDSSKTTNAENGNSKKNHQDASSGTPRTTPTGEKCVKQIVERLETTRSGAGATKTSAVASRQTNGAKSNATGPPRIIDSKCIEKKSSFERSSRPPKPLVINTSKVTKEQQQQQKPPESRSESPLVTVNNSISIAGGAAVAGETEVTTSTAPEDANRTKKPESIYATAKELLEQKQAQRHAATQQQAKTKVVRNRNVDLALSIAKNQKNATDKKEVSSQPPSGVNAKKLPAQVTTTTNGEQRPHLTTFSQQHNQLKRQKDKRVLTKDITSRNGKPEKVSSTLSEVLYDKLPPVLEQVSTTQMPDSPDQDEAQHRHLQQQQQQGCIDGQKMIKWGSLNATQKFDEKFYVSNDAKLRQRKVYDEMEFEEFEVYDTATAAAAAAAAASATTTTTPVNECYDSLNSNK